VHSKEPLFCEFHDEDRVLSRKAKKHHESDLLVESQGELMRHLSDPEKSWAR
jgi:hypothetical protein